MTALAQRLRAAAEAEKLEDHVTIRMWSEYEGSVRFPEDSSERPLFRVRWDDWWQWWQIGRAGTYRTRDAAIRAGLLALAEMEETR